AQRATMTETSMQATESTGDVAPAILQWIESQSGAAVSSVTRVSGGLSRKAYRVAFRGQSGRPQEMFLLLQSDPDKGGNQHDARVLAALADTGVAAPRVIGFDAASKALLMEKLDGESDFAALGDAAERAAVTEDLMRNLAHLHSLDAGHFAASGLELPGPGDDCAQRQLAPLVAMYARHAPLRDPLFEVAIAWLCSHMPAAVAKIGLVHGDIGPGNFLFADGRVT